MNLTLPHAVVVFIYDSFLTFNREVACFWTRKRTGAAFLFFANKSLHITVYILFMVELAHFPSDKVSSFEPIHDESDHHQRFV